jgi:two-component system catabolic regulation response regulator CreB
MNKASILLVEDEAGIAESIRYLLERDFFQVTHVTTLAAARARLLEAPAISLVVLDLGLPDGSGLELLRELKACPAIVLTSRADEVDRILGLELGADDYVTKPFSPRELVARVKTVLRRAAAPAASKAPSVPGLKIEPERRRMTFGGVELPLTRVEFDLLSVLAEGPGRVFTREVLLERLWADATVTDRTIDVHIRGLRKKLRAAGADELIETVRGVGYRARE